MEPHGLAALIEQTVSEGGSFRLLATGNSMFPFLRSGRDFVELVSPERRRPGRNEIVLFRRKNQPPASSYVLHRVLRTLPDGTLVMNGDSQNWTEEIAPGQVIAVAETILRGPRALSCGNPLYRFAVNLWRLTRPLRYPLSVLYLKFHTKEKNE